MRKSICSLILMCANSVIATAAQDNVTIVPGNPPVKLSIDVSQCTAPQTSRSVVSKSFNIVGRSAPIRLGASTKDGSLKGTVHFDIANKSMTISSKFVSPSNAILAQQQGTLPLDKGAMLGSFVTGCESPDDIGKYLVTVFATPARSEASYVNVQVEQCQAPAHGKAVKRVILDETRSLDANLNAPLNATDAIAGGGSYQFDGSLQTKDIFSFKGTFTAADGEAQAISADFPAELDGSVTTTRSCLAPEDLNQYVLEVQYTPGTAALQK